MRPERGLVARAALEAPDGSFVVRRLARRVAPPRTREDARPRGIHRREVPPELEDDLEDPERDDEEHELVELEGPDDEGLGRPPGRLQFVACVRRLIGSCLVRP